MSRDQSSLGCALVNRISTFNGLRVSRLAYERRATPCKLTWRFIKQFSKDPCADGLHTHTQPTIREREDGMKEGISASMNFTSNLNTDRFEGT